MKRTHFAIIYLCMSTLPGCMTMSDSTTGSYQSYTYEDNLPVLENYNVVSDYNNTNYKQRKPVVVPESYHVGAYHSPVSAKENDRNWVTNQDPTGYTIEVADDKQASLVAKKLYVIPKNDRMAEIKYQRNGEAYYKGVYGSYKNQEEAQNALNNLPDHIKKSAGIKNWKNVQSNLEP